MSRPEASRVVSLVEGVRQLAEAFGHISDFGSFVGALERSVRSAGLFESVVIQIPAGRQAEASLFARQEFAFPAGRSVEGVVRIGPAGDERPFSAEDLHLMSGLAALVGALADHAVQYGEVVRRIEALRYVLELAPVGVLCIDGSLGIVACNEKARLWLGRALEAPERELERYLKEGADREGASRGFYLRTGGKLIFGQVSPVSRGADAADAIRAVILTDLTPEQGRLLDSVQREVYRCQWLGRPLGFVLVEASSQASDFLRVLPELRACLQPGEIGGPYDAHRIGIVFPECDRSRVIFRLRHLRSVLGPGQLAVGMAFLDEAAVTADELLDRALEAKAPIGEILRPRILAHDDYPGVNDTIELLLGREFRVVKSSRLERTRELIRTEPFDLLITELELKEGATGWDLAQMAARYQPLLRPLFTSCSYQALSAADPSLPDPIVLRKPFRSGELARAVRSVLAGLPRG